MINTMETQAKQLAELKVRNLILEGRLEEYEHRE